MLFNKDYIWLGLRSCLICGSFNIKDHELCEICFSKIEVKCNLLTSEFKSNIIPVNFPVVSLINWIPQDSDHLSKFFLNIKGTKKRKIWNKLANIFLKQGFNNKLMSKSQLITKIIPCPSKSNEPDHAEQWAIALAQTMSWEYDPVLRWSTQLQTRSQKEKSRLERWSFKSEKHVKFTTNQSSCWDQQSRTNSRARLIFVDDVLTTGATATQAYLALGKPKNFMVLTLGKRASLAHSDAI